MRFSDMVRIRSSKKYTCMCCMGEITADKIGLLSNNGYMVCDKCAPEVDRKRKDLLDTFMLINNHYPQQDAIDAINQLALQIGG